MTGEGNEAEQSIKRPAGYRERVSACESGDDCDFVRRTGKTGRNLGGGVHVPVSGKCRNQQREVIDGSEIHNDQTESPVQPKIYGLSA